MYCPNCGKEVPEGVNFCPNCGNSINSSTARSQPQTVSNSDQDIPSTEQQSTPSVPDENITCPKCGAVGCTPHYKQNVSGGGYGCLQGSLGALILGPFGLLCGLCGRSTKTTNNLVWICPKCGHEFQVVNKGSVVSNLFILVLGVEALIAGILTFLANVASNEVLMIVSLFLAVCGLCSVIASKNALPENPLTYLTDEQEQILKKFAVFFGAFFALVVFVSFL